ncbi:MAG: hypothetical protein ACLQBY_10130 [Solirubrobacteraceae bacterium]
MNAQLLGGAADSKQGGSSCIRHLGFLSSNEHTIVQKIEKVHSGALIAFIDMIAL